MDTLTVLVAAVDRDSHASLREALAGKTGIAVIGEWTAQLEQQLQPANSNHEPHVLLVDVSGDEEAAFTLLASMAEHHIAPFIVSSTRADYAAAAYDIGAADYLVRPFTPERFERALHRARQQIVQQLLMGSLTELMPFLDGGMVSSHPAETNGGSGDSNLPIRRIVLNRGSRLSFLDVDSIDWIEAADTYVRLHTGSKSHLVRARLKDVDERLDHRQFIRIHRSTLVNVKCISDIVLHPNGGAIVTLRDGTELKMSRQYLSRYKAGRTFSLYPSEWTLS